jgi:HSP20 family protein
MKLISRNKKKDNASRRQEWRETAFDLPAMFDNFVARDLFQPSFSNTGVSTPAVNIIETNDDFRLEMVAPGMRKESFNLELQDDILTISYDHDDNREGARREWNYLTHEYNYHSFSRSFSLPETVEHEKIQAKYENGILNVLMPKKAQAKSRPAKRIVIN